MRAPFEIEGHYRLLEVEQRLRKAERELERLQLQVSGLLGVDADAGEGLKPLRVTQETVDEVGGKDKP
jgi:hypothetical protein